MATARPARSRSPARIRMRRCISASAIIEAVSAAAANTTGRQRRCANEPTDPVTSGHSARTATASRTAQAAPATQRFQDRLILVPPPGRLTMKLNLRWGRAIRVNRRVDQGWRSSWLIAGDAPGVLAREPQSVQDDHDRKDEAENDLGRPPADRGGRDPAHAQTEDGRAPDGTEHQVDLLEGGRAPVLPRRALAGELFGERHDREQEQDHEPDYQADAGSAPGGQPAVVAAAQREAEHRDERK